MTQGDLVMSMDQLLTKPRLGTCHKFYMQPFTLPNSKPALQPWRLKGRPLRAGVMSVFASR